MPNFTITLTAAQTTRVAKAFGHGEIGDDMQMTWHDAKSEEIVQAIKEYLKNRVQGYEASAASEAIYQTIQAENW